MRVRGPNNVGRVVQTDPTLLRYAWAITGSAQYKKDQEILNVGFNQMFGSYTGNGARRLL